MNNYLPQDVQEMSDAEWAEFTKRRKAIVLTTIVFLLLGMVLYFIQDASNVLFQWVLVVVAVYGFFSMIDDFYRWCKK